MTRLPGPGRPLLPIVAAAARPDRWSGCSSRPAPRARTLLISCYAVTITWRPGAPWPRPGRLPLTRQARFWNQGQRTLKWATTITPTPRRSDEPGRRRSDEPGRRWCRPPPHQPGDGKASSVRREIYARQAVARFGELGLLQGLPSLHPIRAVELTPPRGGLVLSAAKETSAIGGKGVAWTKR